VVIYRFTAALPGPCAGNSLLPCPYDEVQMKAPQRARRSTACPATTTKIKKRQKPPKANQRGRFETLVLRYYSGVYSFASRLTDDPVEAVVLTHVAFISTRRQLLSRRNEVAIVTILLTAVIRAAGIAKLEEANRTTRVHANTPVTEWNRDRKSVV